MNRSVFVDDVARKAKVTRAMAERVVSAIFASGHGVIAEAVAATGDVEIDGFGTFEAEIRRRSGRNGKENGKRSRLEIKFRPSPRFALPDGCEEDEEIAAEEEEAAIRREIAEGFSKGVGMEIENVFPGGWADEKIRP